MFLVFCIITYNMFMSSYLNPMRGKGTNLHNLDLVCGHGFPWEGGTTLGLFKVSERNSAEMMVANTPRSWGCVLQT